MYLVTTSEKLPVRSKVVDVMFAFPQTMARTVPRGGSENEVDQGYGGGCTPILTTGFSRLARVTLTIPNERKHCRRLFWCSVALTIPLRIHIAK